VTGSAVLQSIINKEFEGIVKRGKKFCLNVLKKKHKTKLQTKITALELSVPVKHTLDLNVLLPISYYSDAPLADVQ